MVNQIFEIISLKHDQKIYRKWAENKLFYEDGTVLIGGNYRTEVIEFDGRKWKTTEPAIFYFPKNKWFHIIIVFQNDDYYFYCNFASPFTVESSQLIYIDYDIDVIVKSDYSYRVVDKEEYYINRRKYQYQAQVDKEKENAVQEIKQMIERRHPPFHTNFVNKWSKILYESFC